MAVVGPSIIEDLDVAPASASVSSGILPCIRIRCCETTSGRGGMGSSLCLYGPEHGLSEKNAQLTRLMLHA